MRIFLVSLAAMLALVALVMVIGACLPRAHRAARTVVLQKSSAAVYAVIRDFAGMPSWRSGLERVEVLPPHEGNFCFRKISAQGAVAYIVLVNESPIRIVTQMAEKSLPDSGTWIYELTSVAGGTRLRITERGEVKNVLFRFLARFVFGYAGTMEKYLRELGKHVHETVAPAA